MPDAQSFLATSNIGKITAVHMHMYRNTPHGKPQWARPVHPDMTSENILWDSFQGEAAKHPFDPNRYINWRFFWDYSGGNVYENMCHQISFWYKALNLQIPKAVTMTGGLYLWKDGREVPDTMNVSLEQPEEMLISWDSGFGNNALGSTESVLGTDGTISKGQQIRYARKRSISRTARSCSGQQPPRLSRTCKISSIASARARKPTAPSISASKFPSPAAWPWTAIARAIP